MRESDHPWTLTLTMGDEQVMVLSSEGERLIKGETQIALVSYILGAAKAFADGYLSVAQASNSFYAEHL